VTGGEEEANVEAGGRAGEQGAAAGGWLQDAGLYRGTVDAMDEIVHVVDRDLRILLANREMQRWCERLGVGPVLVGRTVLELFGFLPWSVQAEYEQVLATGEALVTEECNELLGERRHTVTRKIPVRGAGGEVVRVVTIVRDVTEQKRAEEALRASEQRFRAIADYTYGCEVWMGPEGRLLWVNPAAERLTGYTPAEILGMGDYLGRLIHEEDRERLEQLRGEVIAQRSSGEGLRLRIRRKDGAVRWVEACWHEICGSEGEYLGTRGSVQDITERKEAEDRLREYQRRLRSLAAEVQRAQERERQQIAADLHDELGQILAACKFKAGMLREKATATVGSGAELNAADLAAALEEMRELLEQAIRYTRSLTIDLSPPVLYELGLEAGLEWLAEQTQERHGLAVRFTRDELAKPVTPEMRALVFHAVRELLFNVVKHAQASRAEVRIGRKGGNWLVVQVEDDGVGFDARTVCAPGYRGRGFGLFHVREQTAYAGGRLKVWSRPGQGTRVTLEAPLAEGA